MIVAQLKHHLIHELDESQKSRDEAITFAASFCFLVLRHIPTEYLSDAVGPLTRAVQLHTDFPVPAIKALIHQASQPSARIYTNDDQLNAFRAMFGATADEQLREQFKKDISLGQFVAEYGSDDALLLIDTMIAALVLSGDTHMTSKLHTVAAELNVDEKMVAALLRSVGINTSNDPLTVPLPERPLLIGRSDTADISLPDPGVALHHATLTPSVSGWHLADLHSGRPTMLNGTTVQTSPLSANDTIKIGPYTLVVNDTMTSVAVTNQGSQFTLSVQNLCRKIGDTTLLDDVNFTIFSGEVVALVGPSGAGKTTLLNAISGVEPGDTGSVSLDQSPFHPFVQRDPSVIGLVPQDDVVHAQLTVSETLQFAAKLRLPSNMTAADRQQRVDAVINELQLSSVANSLIGDQVGRGISGGERKRVNVGTELLSLSTKILFLDEPTSGLDPQTSADIVTLIRQLADDGRIVFLVTHDVTSPTMSMVDHLMVLAPHGRLAWFGPPNEAIRHFGVSSTDQIFGALGTHSGVHWQQQYRQTDAFRKYVRTRQFVLGNQISPTGDIPRPPVTRPTRRFSDHFRHLTERYALTKLRDTSGSLVMVGQAPILALAIITVFPAPDTAMLFMLALSAFWFGASGSVRELISDRHLYLRERRVGLGAWSYLSAKVTVLGALVTLQCCALASLVWWGLDMGGDYNYNLAAMSSVLTLTGWAGMSMGLMISSFFRSSVAAVSSLPLWLIPQIAFGGLIVKVNTMTDTARVIADTMVTRYAFEGLIKCGDSLSTPATRGLDAQNHAISGDLYLLGFRTHHVEDMGYSNSTIMAILITFSLVFLTVSWLNIRRLSRPTQ